MEAGGSGRHAQGSEVLPSLKQKALATRPRAVLEGMLSTASGTLEIGLSSTLNEAEQQLFKLAEQARSNEQQNRCFEALREIRRGRADVVPRFMLRLEAALASLGDAHEAPSFARLSRTQRDELSLIDPGEFEESLALQEISSKAEIRNSQALFALGQRFAVLAGSPAFEADELPIGPHRLCDCLRHAAMCLDLSREHRVLVYRMFDRHCMSLVGTMYEQANDLCVRQRILPNLQLNQRFRKAAGAPAAGATPPNGNTPPATPPPGDAARNTPRAGAAPALGTAAGRGQAGAGATAGTPPSAFSASGGAGPRPPAGSAGASPATPPPGSHNGPPPGFVPAEGATGGFANPMTGWPGTPAYHPDHAGETDSRDMELFETLRDLLAGRRHAMGVPSAPQSPTQHTIKTDDVQAVLGSIQAKPAPPMQMGGKVVTRTVAHLKQDVLNQLRQVTPDGKQPKLSEPDGDTMDLVGMLFETLTKDVKPSSTVQDLLTRLQIPLLRVALKDKSFFTRRAHPARQLLNAVAEAGLFWLDDESDDRALVEKMRLVVDRVTQEYDENLDLFEELLGDLSKHLGTLARKSEVAERRHVDAAKGRERLDLARETAQGAIRDRLKDRKTPALARTLLEQAWTDVLALTILRQGEGSDVYKRRVEVAERLLDRMSSETRHQSDDLEARALRSEVEAGLSQVGYHGEDVQSVVNRLFGGNLTAANDDPASLTELAVKLKQRSRLGEDAGPDLVAKTATTRQKLHPPLTPEETRVLERLKTVPFGTWFEFNVNQQGDRVRRKMSWFSTVTGRCLFVNQRGARVDERSLEQLAREIHKGQASVVEAQKESLIDRAWNAIMSTLKTFSGKVPKPA